MAHVLDYLQGRGVAFTVIPHPRTSSEGEPSGPPGVPDELRARTIVVIANFGPAVLVVPAARNLDLDLAAEAVGDRHVRLANERELESRFGRYEPGALPPLTLLLLAPMFVDPAVAERNEVVFRAGRRDVWVRMATRDLFGNDPIVVAPLTAESRAAARTP